jgi:hypothetical protein
MVNLLLPNNREMSNLGKLLAKRMQHMPLGQASLNYLTFNIRHLVQSANEP